MKKSYTAMICAAITALSILRNQTAIGQVHTNLLDPLVGQTSDMIQGTDGNFYGTGNSGGTPSGGAFFQYNPTSNTVTILHSFSGGTNGDTTINVSSPLTRNGTVYYGSTYVGGTSNGSTIFSINQDGTGFNTFYTFSGLTGRHSIWSIPLIVNNGSNVVVLTSPRGGSEVSIVCVNTNGSFVWEIPMTNYSALAYNGIAYWNSNIYAISEYVGSTNISEDVFEVNPTSQTFTVKYSSTASTPGSWFANLEVGPDNKLWVVSDEAVLRFESDTNWTPTLLATFQPNSSPNLPAFGLDGAAYVSTRTGGGNGYGSIQRLGPNTATNNTLYTVSLSSGPAGINTGPGALVNGQGGIFYGTSKTVDPTHLKDGEIFGFYVPVPPGIRFANFNITNGLVTVTCDSTPGQSYTLQGTNNLAAAWQNLTASTVAGSGQTALTCTNQSSTDATNVAFYRVETTMTPSSFAYIYNYDSLPVNVTANVTAEGFAINTNTYPRGTNGGINPPAPSFMMMSNTRFKK